MNALDEIRKAEEFDPSLKLSRRHLSKLNKTMITAKSFSQKRLYDNIFKEKTILFKDCPVKPIKFKGNDREKGILNVLKKQLPQDERINIKIGKKRSVIKVSTGEIIERWNRGRSIFSVTDLHFRETDLYNKIDTRPLSYFNFLPSSPPETSFLEMLTLIISKKGIFTDSHSDDGDGSNHCFVGKKLWFAWDQDEGSEIGLEDCSKDAIYDQAEFDLDKFTSLKSAHWFVVSDNQTLFMPGRYAHKVITLESYLGFGSFYISFANYINLLTRWLLNDMSDVTDDFLKIMNKYSLYKINQINRSSPANKERYGYNYFGKSVRNWKNKLSNEQVNTLLNDEILIEYREQLKRKGYIMK